MVKLASSGGCLGIIAARRPLHVANGAWRAEAQVSLLGCSGGWHALNLASGSKRACVLGARACSATALYVRRTDLRGFGDGGAGMGFRNGAQTMIQAGRRRSAHLHNYCGRRGSNSRP